MNFEKKYTDELKLLLKPFLKNDSYSLDPNKEIYHILAPKIVHNLENLSLDNVEIKPMHKVIFLHLLKHAKIDFSRTLENFGHKVLGELISNLFSSALYQHEKEGNIFSDSFISENIDKKNQTIQLHDPINIGKIFTRNILQMEEFRNFIKNELVLYFLERIAIRDTGVEIFFIKIRQIILEEVILDPKKINDKYFISFVKSISKNCFNNEYSWMESLEETHEIKKLTKIVESRFLEEGKAFSIEILILSSYQQLFNYQELRNYILGNKNSDLKAITKEQILDFIEEEEIEKDIKKITSISNTISLKVSHQYESHPYPRWNFESIKYPKNYNYFDYIKASCNKKLLNDKKIKKLLVAGCGTGRHPINIALLDSKIEIHAIDLSIKSLAYAARKANEMGIRNIKWMHGDINEFKNINEKYDVIESVGVLHHMEKPKIGFEILSKKLTTDGLMKIGLYSRSFRKLLTPVKNFLHLKKIKKDKQSIRLARQLLISEISNLNNDIFNITKMSDFYSISGFIDLLLHEQELDFEISDIKEFYRDKFKFLGFDINNKNKLLLNKLTKERLSKTNLTKIEDFVKIEDENQTFFSNMYQFWLQKS